MPVTMQQFEDLTNEMLLAVNKVTAPHALDADYMAQVVMSALHGRDKKSGVFNKHDLFEACISFISNHVTYHAVQVIQKRLQEKQDSEKSSKEENSGLQLVDDENSPDSTR